jgi:hypothetical protein
MENSNELLEIKKPAVEPARLDWEFLVAAWRTSGLTREEFCQQHQLNYRQFLYQIIKLRSRKPQPSPWLSVKQASLKSSLISTTATAAQTTSGFLLRSLQGHQLSIPLDADTPTLKILLAFMREN